MKIRVLFVYFLFFACLFFVVFIVVVVDVFCQKASQFTLNYSVTMITVVTFRLQWIPEDQQKLLEIPGGGEGGGRNTQSYSQPRENNTTTYKPFIQESSNEVHHKKNDCNTSHVSVFLKRT